MRDVWDDYNRWRSPQFRVARHVELVVRTGSRGDLILDLDSITAHGQAIRGGSRTAARENEQPTSNDEAIAGESWHNHRLADRRRGSWTIY